MKPVYWILIFVFAGLVLLFGISRLKSSEIQVPIVNLVSVIESPVGFQLVEGPRTWIFPDDYGPHPDFQTEWWYYTGNLSSNSSERFGYQLTFFRRALLPPQDRAQRTSAWATDQIYMAHFALSDIAAGRHYAFERFSRGAMGLAGARAKPYQVWLENWQIVQIAEGQYHLTAEQANMGLDLILEDLKGPIFHGKQGYSQKGPEDGNASYYFSQTRLLTSGNVWTADGNYLVSGLSWKDHEFSTGALSKGQVGWDWFSIQLNDDSEVMFFQIRRQDGSIDPFSSGTYISPKGETTPLDQAQFQIQVQEYWRSPHSGAEYPAAWSVEIPSLDLDLDIKPYLNDQEMNVSYTYWEGAVAITGTSGGIPVSGSGYVEMTGYAASMEGDF